MKFPQNIISLSIAAIFALLIFLVLRKLFVVDSLVRRAEIRTNDPTGDGNYLASRNGQKGAHKGVDIVVNEGDAIYAPFSGQITRYPYPYPGDKNYTGIELVGTSHKLKVFYVRPLVKIGERVRKGQKIATAQDISKKYSSAMKNHIHAEIYNKSGTNIDPTQILKLS